MLLEFGDEALDSTLNAREVLLDMCLLLDAKELAGRPADEKERRAKNVQKCLEVHDGAGIFDVVSSPTHCE